MLAEQDAMNLRLQRQTAIQQQSIVHAEQEAEKVIYWATSAINQRYAGELRSALEAQERKYIEYDEMQQQKLTVYREALSEYEDLRVLCEHEVESVSAEMTELAIQRTKLASPEDGLAKRQGRLTSHC